MNESKNIHTEILENADIEKIKETIEKYFDDNYFLLIDKINKIIVNAKTIDKIENMKYLKELRVFNKDKELFFFWRMKKLNYRFRNDTENELNEDYFESEQFLRNDKNKKLRMRNYINYNELGQAFIEDSRIVEIMECE